MSWKVPLLAMKAAAALAFVLLLAAGTAALDAQNNAEQQPPFNAEHATAAPYAYFTAQTLPADSLALNPEPPPDLQRLVFIHHSTGQNWLADDNGQLGLRLRDNNYYVSDTNYGWGQDHGSGPIGDRTDIGNWYDWFLGGHRGSYVTELYAVSGQWSEYTRLDENLKPDGDNTIVMFKSCFPNSALRGNPRTPVPDINSNPLRGQDAGSDYHTVANAIGIYKALLTYFATRQDKLFVAITAPPLTASEYAANARYFNQWLFNEWLADYPHKNVAVFDFYNVLTTNGGNPNVNDLGRMTGNHHRYSESSGVIEHITNGDNDANADVSEYPSGDDHPSQAGNLKATDEFLPLLNIFWHCWKGSGACPRTSGSHVTVPAPPTGLSALSRGSSAALLRWSSTATNVDEFVISRRVGAAAWVDRYRTVSYCSVGSCSLLDPAAAGNPTTSSYSYTVKACNAAGCSAATPEATVPPVPVGLTAASVAIGQIRLSWSPGPGSAAASYTGYRLFKRQGSCAAGDSWVMFKSVGAARVNWIDEGLVDGQQYAYKLQGFKATSGPADVARGFSWYSNCASAIAVSG